MATKSDRPPTYINVRYTKNATKKGRPSASAAKRSILYYSYGAPANNPEWQVRGQWYDPYGEPQTHGEMMNWVSQEAPKHPYTYQIVISAREGEMMPDDFVVAVNEGLSEMNEPHTDYRLITHYDTKHVHAHIVMMRAKTMTRQFLSQWKEATRKVFDALEVQRIEESVSRVNQALSQREVKRRRAMGMDMEM